ncbi:MAG: c-type cytochrome [Phycisphaerales bacterium]
MANPHTDDHDHPHPPSGAAEWKRPLGSGISNVIQMFILAWIIMAPIYVVGGIRVYETWHTQEDARLAAIAAAMAHENLLQAPALPTLDPPAVAHGRDLFASTCAACHGADGHGLKGLGRDLVESDFIAARSDHDLHAFLLTGRPDAKPLPMPPRGGRPDLTDADLDNLIAYVRALQDPRRMPADLPPPASLKPSDTETAAALDAAGGDPELAAYIASGNKLYARSCIACHGADAHGMPNNGKDLIASPLLAELDDDALLEFIKRGRDISDPANTTGIVMPPKGGNPALSDDDILDIIEYLRSLTRTPTQKVGMK